MKADRFTSCYSISSICISGISSPAKNLRVALPPVDTWLTSDSDTPALFHSLNSSTTTVLESSDPVCATTSLLSRVLSVCTGMHGGCLMTISKSLKSPIK